MFDLSFLTCMLAALLGYRSADQTPINHTKNAPRWLAPPDYTFMSNSSLPNVAVFATGGTITAIGPSPIDSGEYTNGAMTIPELIETVPDVLSLSNIYGYEMMNVTGPFINSTHLLQLGHAVNAVLCSPKSIVSGLVVMHGSDTLEETAFFLDLTVNCRKPVVFVASMRPSTAYSPDGPANFLQAVVVAASPSSQDRGVLISMNDRVGSAWYTQKSHLTFVEAFKAGEPGFLGAYVHNRLYYYYTPATPTFKRTFDISNLTSLPRVDILYGHQEFDAHLMEAAVKSGVKGLVLACTCGGSDAVRVIDEIAAKVPVIHQSRVSQGMILPSSQESATISSGLINPQQSRIQLMLCLATDAEAREVFEIALREITG